MSSGELDLELLKRVAKRMASNRWTDDQAQAYDDAFTPAAALALIAQLEAVKAERDEWQRRGDGHWDTLRSIREIARAGDCEKIIQWVNDAGTGYVETTAETVASVLARAQSAEASLAEAREALRACQSSIAGFTAHEGAADMLFNEVQRIHNIARQALSSIPSDGETGTISASSESVSRGTTASRSGTPSPDGEGG